jgi:hypothetical protein
MKNNKRYENTQEDTFMMKTTIVIEHRNLNNQTTEKYTAENYNESLHELIRCFEQTLRGAGFLFDGTLQIIDEKEI